MSAKDPLRYCDAAAEPMPSINELINSELKCTQCGLIGAEYLLKTDKSKAFCHEGCVRDYQGKPSVGAELYGEPNLLCGYDIDTGKGGYCAACMEHPISQSIEVIGGKYSVGLCDMPSCVKEVNAQAFSDVQQIQSWLRRRRLHKTYRNRDVVAAALMLWGAVRPKNAAGTSPIEYHALMSDIFGIISARDQAFQWKSYDEFTTLMRASVDRARKNLNTSGLPPPSNFAELARITPPLDASRIGKTLKRMFRLYNREYDIARRLGKIGIKTRGACPRVPGVLTADEQTLQHDVGKIYAKLSVNLGLGDVEAAHVLIDGLFARPTAELREPSATPSIRSEIDMPPNSALVGDTIDGSSFDSLAPIGEELQAVENIGGVFGEWLAKHYTAPRIDNFFTYALFVAIFRKRSDQKVKEMFGNVVTERKKLATEIKKTFGAEVSAVVDDAMSFIEAWSRSIADNGTIPTRKLSDESALDAKQAEWKAKLEKVAVPDTTKGIPSMISMYLKSAVTSFARGILKLDKRAYDETAMWFTSALGEMRAVINDLVKLRGIDKEQQAQISSSLNGSEVQSIEGPLDWLKRQGRKVRDTYHGVTGSKPYSISSIEKPVYQLFLVNQSACLPSDQVPPALKTDAAVATARSVMDEYATGALLTHGYGQDEANKSVREFHRLAEQEINSAHQRKDSRGSVRKAVSQEEFRRVCGKRSGPGAAGFGQLAQIPSGVGKQFGLMIAYFFDAHVEKRQPQAKVKPGQSYTSNQTNVLTDIRALYSQLAPLVGGEAARTLLLALLKPEDTAREFRSGSASGLKTPCLPTDDDPAGKCSSVSKLGQDKYDELPTPPARATGAPAAVAKKP